MQKSVAAGQSQGSAGSLENHYPAGHGPHSRRRAGGGAGARVRALFQPGGFDPFDEIEWETRSAVIGNEKGELVFEQRDVEMPRFWTQQATNVVVSKYFRGQLGTPEREKSVKQLIGRVVDTITAWARAQQLLRQRGRSADLQRRSEASAGVSEGGVQQPGVVQRRVREAARSAPPASSTPCRTPWSRSSGWRRPRACCSSAARARASTSRHPLVEGAAGGRRHGLGPGLVHEGLRRLRRRHQVGRQDPARGEDGHPQRRPPRRRGVHQLQGRGREEGVGAHRRRLRRLVQRPGLRSVFFQNSNNSVRVTDEFMRAVMDDREWQTRAVLPPARGHRDLQGARPDAADRRSDPHLRRSRAAVRHHGQRLAHLPEHRADQRQQPLLRVHVPGRLGVQPGVDQPDEVRARADGEFDVDRVRSAPAAIAHHRAGDHRRQLPATRRRRSPGTATTTVRWASATPTSARC